MRIIYLSIITISLLLPSLAEAKAVVCVNCSTSTTQLIEKATSLEQLATVYKQLEEAYTQTMQQIKMVEYAIKDWENAIKQAKNLDPAMLSSLEGAYRQLSGLYSSVETQKGDLGGIQEAYNQMYNSFGNILDTDYQSQWENWSKESDRASLATMQETGRQLNDLVNSNEYDQNVQKLLNKPEGQMESMQAGNQLTAIQLQELRELRALTATSAQEQAVQNAKQEKIDQAIKENEMRVFAPREQTLNTESNPTINPFER